MSTRGVELLSAIFLSKKKNGVFDIPALYFKEWCNSKTFPVIDKHDCIYGDFLFDEKIRDFIESYYEGDETYDENIMDFRKKCIRELIFEIVPDRLVEDVDDYITPHDISNFMQTIAKNRIRDDAIVKSQIPVFTSYMAGGTVAWNSDIEAELIKKDDDLSVRLENEGLEALEKEARKKCIAEPYIPYVENLNLEMLKHLLKDNLGNSFVPQGRQKDTLCKLRRFNFFACSRRSGKCQSVDTPIRLFDGTFKRAGDIEIGDRLLASDKRSMNIVRGKTFYKKDLYRVTLGDGTTVDVTGDHRLPTQHNYKDGLRDMDIQNYKMVSELTKEDFVPKMFGFEGVGGTYNEGALYGYFLGNGGCTARGNVISCFSDVQANRIMDIAKDVVSGTSYYDGKLVRIQGFEEYSLGTGMISHRRIGTIDDFRNKYNLHTLSKDKKIENICFGYSNEFKFGLLEGLIATDGYLGFKSKYQSNDGFKRKKSALMEYSSVSRELVEGMHKICDDLGIISYIRNRIKNTRIGGKKYRVSVWYLYVTDNESLIKISQNICLDGKKNYKEWNDCIADVGRYTNNNISVIPLCAFEEKTVKGIGSKQRTYGGVRNPRYDFQRWKCVNYGIEQWLEYNRQRVVSVELLGMSDVVDIEVSGDHLYRAGSILSHNSFLGSYLAARQFYIPNQVIVYIVPTLRTHGKVPRRYLFMMLKGDPNISFNRADRTITNRKNGSEIIFFSGEREDSVRGAAANLLIFDEAAFLSEELYTTAEPLIRTTNGIVYCISTVNTKTPKNRFYYKLVEAEITKYDMNTNKYGLRVSLRENPFIPDAEKQSIAEDGKQNIKLFQAEWMAEFQDGDSFDFSKFWIIDYNPVEIMIGGVFRFFIKDEAIDKTANFYDHFIICHDSAKLKDRPGLAVIGVKFKKNATGELVQQGCEIVGSGYMSGFEYMDQVDLIMKLKDILGKDKTTIVIEYNHGGVTVEELFRRTHNQYVIPVQTIGGVTYIRDGNIWRVGKDLMMGKLSSAIDRGVLRGYSFMEQLRIEIETFDVNESQQTRKAGHHFDIMSAILVGVFFADYSGYMEMYKDTDKDVRADRWHESFGDIWSMNRYEQDNRSEMSRLDKFGY